MIYRVNVTGSLPRSIDESVVEKLRPDIVWELEKRGFSDIDITLSDGISLEILLNFATDESPPRAASKAEHGVRNSLTAAGCQLVENIAWRAVLQLADLNRAS